MTLTYHFKEIKKCNFCGNKTSLNKILGQRLNKSQGKNPKSKMGISVSIIKCNSCDLIYSNPQPIPKDIQSHYGIPPESYWKKEYFTINPNYFNYEIIKAKNLISFKKGMKSLDIGAGLGKSMIAMEKAGFDTHGIEPSITFRDKAISQMKISPNKLKLGMIEKVTYENDYFDFITFGAVLEHLYSPSEALEKALKWLKPNGIIHIEVPSSKWLIAKLYNWFFKLRGTNYVTNTSPMHEPYHMYEFDLKSFQKNSKLLGYKIIDYEYSVCNIYFIPKIFHSFLKWYMKKTNTGMQLTIWLKK